MNREIKFRGKRSDNGEWVFGSLVQDNHPEIKKSFIHYNDLNDLFERFSVEINPETVGQLWVINHDFEIYTDDLFTAICSPSGSNNKKERICKVGFDGSGMKAVVWHKKEWWHYGSMNFTTIKIIGNIHDNPELLK